MNAIAPRRIDAAAPVEVALFDDLDAVARDAGGALDRAGQVSLYDRIEWFRLTRDNALAGSHLVVARAALGSARCWLFLDAAGGRRARGYASWYTLKFTPVFAGADGMETALLRAIAVRLRPHFGQIELAPVPVGPAEVIASAFAAGGWSVGRTAHSANWVVDTSGQDFAAYWAARPARLRNTVRRKAKKSDLAIEILDRFDAAVWAEYEQVYRASWKPAEGSPDFLRALAAMESAGGTLRLGVARDGERAVACQFWTVEHGVATIHKLAHLESEIARSPGTLLSEAMFRHVIEHDRPRLIDFGTGDDGYKADWMDERRVVERVTLHNRHSIDGIAGAARARLVALADRLRRG